MDQLLSILHTIGIIVLVILLFNIMIFVHELGHFLAGKWRGAYIDRFQIWFGKPLISVRKWGVTWGLGWIPAGGFVSLPQMGDMESIEGSADVPRDLKPLIPLDKIIIAAAGPLFSLLLAYVFAVVVWAAGKPTVDGGDSTIGYVLPDSPAAQAGLLPGDRITAIDGKPVSKWVDGMEGVSGLIALGEHSDVTLTIERPQADGSSLPLTVTSGYTQEDNGWMKRSGMRKIGILPSQPSIVGPITPGSPAEKAGLQPGQHINAVDGQSVYSPIAIMQMASAGKPMQLTLSSPDGSSSTCSITPAIPANWEGREGARPIMGFTWLNPVDVTLEYPSPQSQVSDSLELMYDTVVKIAAPDSNVGVQHLSGPVGIGTLLYDMLTLPDGSGWRWVFWFAVVLNVNLAVLNMLPLPVVDGGHVVMGVLELIRRKPLPEKLLGVVQGSFLILLLGFFIFITVLDVNDAASGGKERTPELPQPVFAP